MPKREVHIHVHTAATRDNAEFESKHARGEAGRFGSGGKAAQKAAPAKTHHSSFQASKVEHEKAREIENDIKELTEASQPQRQGFGGTHSSLGTGQSAKPSAKVVTETYSWGKLRKVRKGNSVTAVVHPEDAQDISELTEGAHLDYEDEQKVKWRVTRMAELVQFKQRTGGSASMTAPHSDFK